MFDFEQTVHGKWILTGEHSVLRGQPALVFPVTQKSLTFQYTKNNEPLTAVFEGANQKEYEFLFWGVIEKALQKVGKQRRDLNGQMKVQSNLPIGTGLGASAALCVGVTRFLTRLGWVEEREIYEFARSLEDMFHGESSGVDIAVALRGRPLEFSREGAREPVTLSWQPNWAISYCGRRGVTSDCIDSVKERIAQDPELGEQIDNAMGEATRLAKQALAEDMSLGFDKLKSAIQKACQCFESWGLINASLKSHIENLRAKGAVAVKPTGSGGGGFVLSLWSDSNIPQQVDQQEVISLGPFL